MDCENGAPGTHPPPGASQIQGPGVGAAAPRHKKARRLGLAPPAAALARDVVVAPPELVDSGEEGAMASQARKKPPRNPSVVRGKRKAPAMPTIPAMRIPANPSHPAASGSSSPAYDIPPASSSFAAGSPASYTHDAQYVFGEMPTSVDDETFLDITDGDNFGIEMNPTYDVDEQTFGPQPLDNDEVSSDDEVEVPKKKGGRGVNFTVLKDETVVKAWQAVALYPIVGAEQPGATYWKRIHDHFCENNKSGIFQSQISVTHRWQFIQVCCSKWASCLEQVERLNPSGANAPDKVNIAKKIIQGQAKEEGWKVGKGFCIATLLGIASI